MRKTQKIPFHTARASRQGRPRFRLDFGWSKGWRSDHGASVRSRHRFCPSPRPSTTPNSTYCNL